MISQGIYGLLCLVYIARSVPELHLKREDWKLRKGITINQISVGFPMGIQYSITAIYIFSGICGHWNNHATYNAQNIGAGRLDRVREGFHASHILGGAYAVITGVILAFLGKNFAYLFILDTGAEVIPMVDLYLKCSFAFLCHFTW